MNTRKIPVIIAWGILILAATTFGVWWVMSLRDPYELAAFQERIASLGIAGWIVLLGMQYVRVVLAFIPGGPVQIVTGAILGPLGGVAVIVAGIVLANATIFALVRRFGQRVLDFFIEGETLSKYGFIGDRIRSVPQSKLVLSVLVLYLIPIVPADALTYIFALTPLKFWLFTLLSIVARMPGILISVFAGDNIIQGGYWQNTAMLFGVLALLVLAGIILKGKLEAYVKNR